MQPLRQEAGASSMPCQTVLVTGATGVLGSAVVRFLLADSRHIGNESETRVVANYCHSAERAQRLQDETGCEIFRADVSVESEVEALFSHCSALFAVVHL